MILISNLMISRFRISFYFICIVFLIVKNIIPTFLKGSEFKAFTYTKKNSNTEKISNT